MKDIIAIGSATRDVFLETSFPAIDSPEVPSGKELLVPLGGKFRARDAHFTVGGNAVNASITFARQGFKTAVATKTGEDEAAREIRSVLHKNGVDTRFMASSAKYPTNYSVLLLQEGERTIIGYHGALDTLARRDIPAEALASKWWYVSLTGGSYTLFPPLLGYARKNGVFIALNPGWQHLTDGRSALLKALPYISFLVLNEEEAAALTGIPFSQKEKVFKELDRMVPGIVAVTHAADGATVSDGRFLYRAGVVQPKQLLDSTGAGDAFGSGFVAGLMRMKERCVKGVCRIENIEYAIRLAIANATSVVEHIGGNAGILTKASFEKQARFKNIRIHKEPLS